MPFFFCFVFFLLGCRDVLITGRYKGVVESLNFPNTYPSNSQCSWTIQGTSGNNINYTFTAFDLESSYSSCAYDYVKVPISTSSDAGELRIAVCVCGCPNNKIDHS